MCIFKCLKKKKKKFLPFLIKKRPLWSNLVEEDAHDEEVQQEALRGVRTVKVEKDQREEQREELETGVAEGRAQQLQSRNGGQQDVAAAGASNRK